MIVRILTEGQYDLSDASYDELNELDNRVVRAVEASDEDLFHATFEEMLALVREKGTPLADDDLQESALILPPPDLSIVEAKREFVGEGMLPD